MLLSLGTQAMVILLLILFFIPSSLTPKLWNTGNFTEETKLYHQTKLSEYIQVSSLIEGRVRCQKTRIPGITHLEFESTYSF
ncbi:hypothetical protein L6164_019462 [Bauhinia variegata]|uniref:Uncharacterized protein n=1 Tax=Bauhinia variegata TaxID=167791 RepID=A0ACB9MRR3_BAUVA|nr:hypothetical protein L6164_019462 [Bauhinia variegata]